MFGRKKTFNKTDLYILPLLLFVFIINYHYYRFVENEANNIFRYVVPSLKINQYEEVQKYHSFYDIYLAAKNTENKQQSVTYLLAKPQPKDKFYLPELTVMFNYFFYPRSIKPTLMKNFKVETLKKNDIIISDSELIFWTTPLERLNPPPPVGKYYFHNGIYSFSQFYIYKVL